MKDFAENFDLNNYEFNSQSNKGIYIIHGFSSTTHEVKELAEFLGSCGFHTRANNLPGHATNVDDCNNSIYNEWLEYVERDFADMISQNEKIYVIGASMGGALALHLASLFPINGIVTCAAVLHFKDHFTLQWINPLTKFFYKTVSKRKRFNKNIRNDLKFNGYNQYPLVALNEYFKMAKLIKSRLNKISAPIMILSSKKDLTAPKINVSIINDGVKSNIKKVKEYEHPSHAMLMSSADQRKIFEDILKFIQSN